MLGWEPSGGEECREEGGGRVGVECWAGNCQGGGMRGGDGFFQAQARSDGVLAPLRAGSERVGDKSVTVTLAWV